MLKVISVAMSVLFGFVIIAFLGFMIEDIRLFFSTPTFENLAYFSLDGIAVLIGIVAIWEMNKVAFRR